MEVQLNSNIIRYYVYFHGTGITKSIVETDFDPPGP